MTSRRATGIAGRQTSPSRRTPPIALLIAALLSTLVPGVAAASAAPVASTARTGQPAAGPAAVEPVAAEDESRPVAVDPPAGGARTVVIDEIANGTSRSSDDSFFELRNVSGTPVDLTGWDVYRCNALGLRPRLDAGEADLAGVVLAPGEVFTVARSGSLPADVADASITQGFSARGFGLLLVDPDGARVDAVGVYPNEPWPTQSECTFGPNLPNTLAFALDESWQRVGVTGDPDADWVRARATPGVAGTRPPEASAPEVRVEEIAAAGVESDGDDLVEVANRGGASVDLGGWRMYRCTAAGRLTPDTLMAEFEPGTVLAPGERLVVGGPQYSGGGTRVVRNPTSLAQSAFGALLVTPAGDRVTGVAVSAHDDSACQHDAKLPPDLDAATGESWQRTGEGVWVVARRTPGAENARTDTGLAHRPFAYPDPLGVAVSEFAVDPSEVPTGSARHHFVELANYGAEPVDIGGWRIRGCGADGYRLRDALATVAAGTVLAPGGTWVAAARDTASASDAPESAFRADATLAAELDFRGAGYWVETAAGRPVDRVGAYAQNEMDRSVEVPSACSKGVSLAMFQPDRLAGETYRRAAFTGVDADDFVADAATPGVLDLVAPASEAAPATSDGAATTPVLARRDLEEVRRLRERHTARAAARGTPLTVVAAWAGASDGRLTTRIGADEREIGPGAPVEASDDGFALPYVRQRVAVPADASADGVELAWNGTAIGRAGVVLSVWDGGSWRALAEGVPEVDGRIALAGRIEASEIRDGEVELLVQAGSRATTLPAGVDGAFAAPADYDFAISHLTDTQYLTEAYPDVYAEMIDWIIRNAADRRIAFATHTGDLVQNWVDPDQSPVRARREFAIASALQARLELAGVPSSVLPGNHDTKRGVDSSLFNEAFPPARYAGSPTWGGSIGPDDNSAHFDLVDAAGACFLMLALPYGYDDRELDWAEEVVHGHPRCNVVVSTHEHLQAADADLPARRSAGSRWMSRADRLWERVIAPNRNVVLVLSGHFHGLGTIVTPGAGGIPGHTVVELLADYQEFRTHTGERSTGFQRLLQVDLAGGAVGVDTWSERLGEPWSHPYDYGQFLRDTGRADAFSQMRPWNIVARGTQNRYAASDDEFLVEGIAFQYPKSVRTDSVAVVRR
ncbi:lamin tail domain-containing protein [Agromyces sp. MMS24-JH15]|uniref:lamin tail domain-containing protein n=1 Tax=Agromyces sp. MMS24-JH15 TaxID=3243765 RepID=UPI0037498668